ncbi:MAG: hypothetical protein EZS28_048017, partial [Streblomastix strix]
QNARLLLLDGRLKLGYVDGDAKKRY